MKVRRLSVVVCAVAAVLAGCGSTPAPSDPTTTVASAPAPSTTGEDCGDTAAAVRAALGGSPEVTGVTVVGQCTSAVVATSLSAGPDGSAAATAICEKAAPIAYAAQDVNTITVKASTGAELAVGIKGASCVASA